MNEKRWEAIKQEINYRVEEKTWLTIDQRADRNEAWFNIIIKKV